MFNIFNVNSNKLPKTIAFAGICPHIGTTTQAIQMNLYLSFKNKKVCYVEMNNTKFLEQMQKLYNNIQFNKDSTQMIYKDIIFYKSEFYDEIKKYNFDYIIKDYGVYNSLNFEKISFLEQDIKIIVAGVKANEIFALKNIIQDAKQNYYYIFNFVPKYDIVEVENLLSQEKNKIFFSPIIVDMFSLYEKNDNFKFIMSI